MARRALTIGCAIACAASVACGDADGGEASGCGALDGRTFTFDMTKLEATTPECRTALASGDLSSGAFSLRTEKRAGILHVSTLGASPRWYAASVDEARGCRVSWNATDAGEGGASTSIEGTIDVPPERGPARARVAYRFQNGPRRCDVVLEGTD